MPGSTFQTNPIDLYRLLDECHRGAIQLPDFQRSWVWDEDRIKSLIASISRAFPVGAIMSLDTGGPVNFKPRPIEGTPPEAGRVQPQSLLLDGQQRLTSLYQVSIRGEVVETVTPKRKKVRRWFYIDIRKALDSSVDRELAIVAVPEDKIERSAFGHPTGLDLSTSHKEYAALMFPVTQVFDWDRWQDGFDHFWSGADHGATRELFRAFKRQVLENFKYYRVPVIALDRTTSKEAVCVVFEKVNTGGKPLDAFELVTAMFAASGHELRKDWYGGGAEKGRQRRLAEVLRLGDSEAGILAGVSNTDFLQAVSLFHTRDKRRAAEAEGREAPPVSGNRQALLDLPLDAYLKYQDQVEKGFVQAAKFLHLLHVYRIFDLPYQSQVVPLAAILADIGSAWEHDGNRRKLVQWYWCGVFGELYGSAAETRIARDFMEVPAWLSTGVEPTTVKDAIFRADRLKTMRMRISAAYKGVNALLMKEGARDFRSGQGFDHTVFFGENVDIHHIFPKKWCVANKILPSEYDSIINKTPLSYRTNRIIGGDAPSKYLGRLEKGTSDSPAINRRTLEHHVASHLLEPLLLYEDRYHDFMADRQRRLIGLIEDAMGKRVYGGPVIDEGEDIDVDDETGERQAVLLAL
ncbi:GmrSD restriction endonuclease domain-containing protein [Zavarzinia aquatilis]|uniref:GmrSD restriction endonucleases N-terminal domain-containing protein n=1 Tax=Zavarzinia aquatilis TaxID=2211142 RepID=A0A317E6G1_9PROT|nr:DUF262 domain-containing protein [Zavarzinia aquatilis]PWR22629.1 hypothetical protein DKG74_12225 [Zavarzinia aquatilis]